MNSRTLLGVAGLLLLLNAFFVGAEFALISARRSAIESRAHAGSRAAESTLRAMEQVSLMMATAQLGITLASLGLGAIGEPALAHLLEGPFQAARLPQNLLHPVSFTLAMVIVVYLHVVVGEMIPKNLALAAPDRAALALGPPLLGISRVLYPFVLGMNTLANLALKAIRVPPKDEVTSAFTREEVAAMVAESRREGLLDEDEQALLSGALSFDEETVAAVTIPAERVVSAAVDQPRRELEKLGATSGFSRIPLSVAGRSDAPEFVGYVHLKDVLTTELDLLGDPVPSESVRSLPRVQHDSSLREVLTRMQSSRVHLAQVDRNSHYVGIVALEDVLSRLVGQITAEQFATEQVATTTTTNQGPGDPLTAAAGDGAGSVGN